MVRASILGLMVGSIKDNGKIICYMVVVYTLGQTEGNMKDTIRMIKKMVRVFTRGLTGKVIMVDGRIVNNTAKRSLQTQKDKVKQVFGKTETE